MSAKFAGLDWLAEVLSEPRQELLVKRNGNFRPGRAGVRGAVPFFGAREQRELADDQDPSICFLNGTIHDSVLVIENPEPDDLSTQPFDVFARVRFFNGDEHEQPLLNGAFDAAVNGYVGFGNALNDGAHDELILLANTARLGVAAPLQKLFLPAKVAAMKTSELKDRIQDFQDRATETARNALQTTHEVVHEHAWKSVACAALLGCLLGFLLGRSRD